MNAIVEVRQAFLESLYLYLSYYTECPISSTNFTAVRLCRVTFKIVTGQLTNQIAGI